MKLPLVLLALLSLLPAALGAASVVVASGDSVVLAIPGSVRIFEGDSTAPPALLEGLANPEFGVASGSGLAAIFDPIENRVALVDTLRGLHIVDLGSTPSAAAFLGTTLFVASRDEGRLTRISREGDQSAVETSSRPGFIAISGDAVFTYDAVRGRIERFDPVALEPTGSLAIDRFASDFTTDGRFGYLAIPGTGEVISFSLSSLDGRKSLNGGAVPVDLAVERPAGALTGGTLAIADPSSRYIWRIEGNQSAAAAFGRGFLRGLIGLGLFSPRSSELPTGIDRIETAAGALLAFDSSSGSLYRVGGGRSVRIATGLDPGGYAFEGERVFYALGEELHSTAIAPEK